MSNSIGVNGPSSQTLGVWVFPGNVGILLIYTLFFKQPNSSRDSCAQLWIWQGCWLNNRVYYTCIPAYTLHYTTSRDHLTPREPLWGGGARLFCWVTKRPSVKDKIIYIEIEPRGCLHTEMSARSSGSLQLTTSSQSPSPSWSRVNDQLKSEYWRLEAGAAQRRFNTSTSISFISVWFLCLNRSAIL